MTVNAEDGTGAASQASDQVAMRVVHGSSAALNMAYPDNTMRSTKYTFFSFIPLNLAEQFSRHQNRYYLLIGCLQLIAVLTPVNPLSTWAPIIVIFFIAAAKEAKDDRGRAAQDRIANERGYSVVRGGELSKVQSCKIRVGDVIRLVNGEEVPCDICVLATSNPDGSLLVQTTNLDGETNLKTRRAVSETHSLDTNAIENFMGTLECRPPDANVYRFDARLWLNPAPSGDVSRLMSSEAISITSEQLLQQTTTLRSTEFVYGIVVYTGVDTKFSQNLGKIHIKWTKVDAFINRIAILLFVFQLGLVVVFGTFGNMWRHISGAKHSYLRYEEDEPFYSFLIIPLRFLLLNSTIIPISLKITLDVCKLLYARFIEWDLRMFAAADAENDMIPAKANNSGISEDLGQIELILTDKTGTLTQNEMIFRKCVVNGVLYNERDCLASGRLFNVSAGSDGEGELELLRNFVLNNSVVPSRDKNDRPTYESSSPDEVALVEAAAVIGVRLVSREGPNIEISVHGRSEHYLVLQELSFTSERRRMSVIVRNRKTGTLRLYCKGADDVMVSISKKGPHAKETLGRLDEFASTGLRTLALGHRDINEADYTQWAQRFAAANTSLQDRESRLSDVYNEIEHSLHLIGASAIEDRLQDGVPDTIQSLREANVRFWMLTGDKWTTALQIATTCNLRNPGNGVLLQFDGASPAVLADQLSRHERTVQDSAGTRDCSVVLRGSTLPGLLDPLNRERFLALCLASDTVICCRFSPKQKAEMVRLAKESGKMTLAIGDGGNDVSMIMEAHVGVGIRGREGLQAARAADFQINVFRSLQPLLLIHGRQSYLRTCLVAQYSYYKSFLFCLVQILFGFANGFSGTTLFNSACVTAYNAVLFVPVVTFVLDQDLAGDAVLQVPSAYHACQQSRHFSYRTYLAWMARATYQAIVVYLVSASIYSDAFVTSAGLPSDYEAFGLLAFSSYLTVQSVTVMLELRYLTLVNIAAIWGFHLLTMMVLFISNSLIQFDNLIGYGSYTFVMGDPVFWLAQLLTCAIAILPVVALQYLSFTEFPSTLQLLRSRLVLTGSFDHKHE